LGRPVCPAVAYRPTISRNVAYLSATRLAEAVPPALGDRLAAVVVGWLSPQPAIAHADVLGPVLAGLQADVMGSAAPSRPLRR
jgi:hypothetical protein